MKFKSLAYIFLALGGMLLTNSYVTTNSISALSMSGFDASNIIDDATFYDANAMDSASVQNFLNSKVAHCDTQGDAMYNSTQTVRQFWTARGEPAPYTCLKDYSQKTPYMPASNFCSAIPAYTTRTAAQIITDVSKACGVSPKVMLVLLQKEQFLVSDNSPLKNLQYGSATGFGCPDTAACDSAYDNFYYQVYYAARQYRVYQAYPNSYNHIAGRNNLVRFSPETRCGSSWVNIKNQATAGLYNYTPYQPNEATKNVNIGVTVDCGAYGNKNFWWWFTSWFGSTTTQANYTWSVQSQQTSVDNVAQGSNNITLAPGQSGKFTVKAKNTGNRTWTSSSARLATSRPNDRVSVLEDTSWISSDRAATLKEASVAPGDVGTFEFTVTAPNSTGQYKEYFNIVLEGQAWLVDPGLYFTATIKNPSTPFYNVQILERKLYRDAAMKQEVSVSNAQIEKNGSKLYGSVRIKNTGNQPLDQSFTYLATTVDRDRNSLFRDTSWIGPDRIAKLTQTTVAPGNTGSFNFILSSPDQLGLYTENFGVVAEGRAWADTDKALFRISTVEPVDHFIQADTSLLADRFLRSTNMKYTFTVQSDGNLVLYNSGRAIWSSNTAGRGASNLTLQSDGNLVVYSNGRATWSNNMAGRGASNLIVQDDGNLVIYNNGRPIWSSGTAGR